MSNQKKGNGKVGLENIKTWGIREEFALGRIGNPDSENGVKILFQK